MIVLISLSTSGCNRLVDVVFKAQVWEDRNGNGEFDDGEIPLEDIGVQFIIQGSGIFQGQTISDQNGVAERFSAGGRCGSVLIVVVVPQGFRPSTTVLQDTQTCETAMFGLVPLE